MRPNNASNPGQLTSKGELLDAVWSGVDVAEGSQPYRYGTNASSSEGLT